MIRCDADVVVAQVRARLFALRCGFSRREQWELAVASSEACTNMLKYAGGGTLRLQLLQGTPACIELEAVDGGPGITDAAQAMCDGVSEGKQRREARDLRAFRGLGLGLGALRRMMDELVILPLEKGGTRLLARKRRKG